MIHQRPIHCISHTANLWLAAILLLFIVSSRAQAYTPADSVTIIKMLTEAYGDAGPDPQGSIVKANAALKLAKEKNFVLGIEKSLRTIGYAYTVLGDAKNALRFLNESLEMSRASGHRKDEAKTLFHIGFVYARIGDDVRAFEMHTQSLKLHEALKDSLEMADLYSALAISLMHQKQQAAANKYIQQAIDMCHALNDRHMEAVYLSFQAINYVDQKRYADAYASFQASLAIEPTPETYSNLGDYYYTIDKKDSALYCFNIAEQQFTAARQLLEAAKVHGNIGKIYLDRNDLKLAEEHFLKTLALSKEQQDKETIANTEQDLARLYAKMNNYKSAYQLGLSAQILKDSIINTSTQARIAELSARYDVTDMEKKNEKLRNENDLQKLKLQRKNLLIYGTIAALALLIIIGLLLLRQNKLKAAQQATLLEQKQLRAQMNPHFIFNCLNSIQHFVVSNDVKNANKYLSGFASLMRQTLENSKESSITLDREIAYLDSYITLERMRHEDKFTYRIHVVEDITTGATEIPPMIIQPFAENAIRHGLCYLDHPGGHLDISFYKDSASLYCKVDDNGIGRERSQGLKKMAAGPVYESQGMELTRRRLALVSRAQHSEYTIQVIDKNDGTGQGGTTIIIKFPLNI